MPEEKKKPRTSSAVKQKYNAKTYDVIAIRVPKNLAAAFKEKCAAEGLSQAGIIKAAIEEYLAKQM